MRTVLYLLVSSILFFSCSGKSEKDGKKEEEKMEKVEYTYHDGSKDYKVTITTPPQRAALFTPHMTEMLLALGLEDRIVLGTTEGPVLPIFQQAYKKVPNKAIGHSFKLTKEAFLLMEPDFASGDGDFNKESTGTVEELLQQGITPFVLKSMRTPNATLETVYEDFHMLGKIFNVKDKAHQVVEEMKKKLTDAKLAEPTDGKKKTIMVISSFNNGIWVYSSLTTDLAKWANGRNIYDDVDSPYEFVSYESAVHRNPDIIFITDTESRGMSIDDKINLLKTHPVLKNINAVKNNQLYGMNFADVSPGVRNIDFIIRMNNIFYKGGK